MSGGKLEELIKQKRAFLRQALKDYSAGGNDMLDDVEALLEEAKAEITHNLELANMADRKLTMKDGLMAL